jgi:hypothetical protein
MVLKNRDFIIKLVGCQRQPDACTRTGYLDTDKQKRRKKIEVRKRKNSGKDGQRQEVR